jgi:hypothetical protein
LLRTFEGFVWRAMTARLTFAAIERIAAIVIAPQLIHKMRYNKKEAAEAASSAENL